MGAPSGRPQSRVPLSSIDLNLLVALDALLRDCSVGRAGRRIGLSQPAMSHALARLRELLGDPILVREGRMMRRTAVGERLAPRLLQLLSDVESTLFDHRSFVPARARRRFRIATSDYCGAVVMPDLVARIRKLAPGVELEVHAHRGPAPAEELARGELDVALGVFLHVDDSLRVQDLFQERFCCVVRHGHPVVRGTLTLAQFLACDHLLVSVPDYGPGVVDFALAQRSLQRRVSVRVPSFLAAPIVVAGSDLILTLPERIARLMARGQRLRILPPPLELAPFTVQMVWRGSPDDAALAWLRGQLTQSAATIAIIG
jgi:DNA-binding transcriptional LysR family regulator